MNAARNLRLVVDSDAVGTKRTPRATAAGDARQREAEIDKMRAARARERDRARAKLARAGRWTPELAVPLTLPAEADVRAWVLRLPAGVRQVLVRVAASLYVPPRPTVELAEVLRAETRTQHAARHFYEGCSALERDDTEAAALLFELAASQIELALAPAFRDATLQRRESVGPQLRRRLEELATKEGPPPEEKIREKLLREGLRAYGLSRDAANGRLRTLDRPTKSEAAAQAHKRRSHDRD